jgi:hypothetical protein
MARQTRADWAKRIERWKDSGLTAAEFAAETGINAHSLSWWQWKLSAEAKAQDVAPTPVVASQPAEDDEIAPRRKTRRRCRRSKPAVASAMTFVEMTPTTRNESLEVVLAGGRSIRVPVGFDAPTFERLLGILERHA